MLEYELFFRYSMDMYVIAGMDGYFKRANPHFATYWGAVKPSFYLDRLLS